MVSEGVEAVAFDKMPEVLDGKVSGKQLAVKRTVASLKRRKWDSNPHQ